MPRESCSRGCVYPVGHRYAGRPKWHDQPDLCPKHPDFGKRVAPPVEERKAEPSTASAAPTGKSKLTRSGTAAEIVKAPAALAAKKDAVVDFILDGPHVIIMWNTAANAGHDLHKLEARYVKMAAISKEQFILNENQLDTIRGYERNFYARGCTFLLKKIGAKNLKQAQAMVSSGEFMYSFFGLGIALLVWHYHAVKDSPRAKENAANKEKKRLEKLKRQGVIDARGRDLGPVAPTGASA